MSELVGNPEDRFSHNKAHSIPIGSLLESASESDGRSNKLKMSISTQDQTLHFALLMMYRAKFYLCNTAQHQYICISIVWIIGH